MYIIGRAQCLATGKSACLWRWLAFQSEIMMALLQGKYNWLVPNGQLRPIATMIICLHGGPSTAHNNVTLFALHSMGFPLPHALFSNLLLLLLQRKQHFFYTFTIYKCCIICASASSIANRKIWCVPPSKQKRAFSMIDKASALVYCFMCYHARHDWVVAIKIPFRCFASNNTSSCSSKKKSFHFKNYFAILQQGQHTSGSHFTPF